MKKRIQHIAAGMVATILLCSSSISFTYASSLEGTEEAYVKSLTVNDPEINGSETGFLLSPESETLGVFDDLNNMPSEPPESIELPGDEPVECDGFGSPAPVEVQLFLDAVTVLPDDIQTEDEAAAIGDAMTAAMDCYDMLLGTEYENRWDTVEAFSRLTYLSHRIDEVLYGDAGGVSTYADWTQADLAAALNRGGTVVLPNDITVQATTLTGWQTSTEKIRVAFFLQNVTTVLDLNGHTVTLDTSNAASGYRDQTMYLINGRLTIKDSVGGGIFGKNCKDYGITALNSSYFVLEGGEIKGHVIIGNSSTTSPSSGTCLVTGGKFLSYLQLYGNSFCTIDGGYVGYMSSRQTSQTLVSKGQIGELCYLYNDSQLSVEGGDTGCVHSYGNSKVFLKSGKMSSVDAYDSSNIFVISGVCDSVFCYDLTHIEFTGGSASNVITSDTSDAVISGGTISGYVRAAHSSNCMITGGYVDELDVANDSTYFIATEGLVDTFSWLKSEDLEINGPQKYKSFWLCGYGSDPVNVTINDGLFDNVSVLCSSGTVIINGGMFGVDEAETETLIDARFGGGAGFGNTGDKAPISVLVNQGSLIINDGKFNGRVRCWGDSNKTSSCELRGGEFDTVEILTTASGIFSNITAKKLTVMESADVTIDSCRIGCIMPVASLDDTKIVMNSGIISQEPDSLLTSDCAQIIGGKFDWDPANYVPDGYECGGIDGQYFVNKHGFMMQREYAPGVTVLDYMHSISGVPVYNNAEFAGVSQAAGDSKYVTFMPDAEAPAFTLDYDLWTGALTNNIPQDGSGVSYRDNALDVFDLSKQDGDINGDGVVNAYDIGYLRNALAGAESFVKQIKNPQCRNNYIRCDVNGDGILNSDDLEALQKFMPAASI